MIYFPDGGMDINVTPYHQEHRLRAGYGKTSPVTGASGASPYRRRTYRPDGTPDWMLMVVLEGEYVFSLGDGEELLLKPCEAVLFPPYVKQDYVLSESYDHGRNFWAHFYPEGAMLELLRWPGIDHPPAKLNWGSNPVLHEDILACCKRCDYYLNSEYRRKYSMAMVVLEEMLRLINQANSQWLIESLDDRIVGVLRYISSHLENRILVADMAREVGLSASRLSHLFSAMMNCSIGEYIEMQRIRKAVDMLSNTAMTIAQIATMCGFDSPFYFSRRFKKHKGVSPSSYRKDTNRLNSGSPVDDGTQ